MEGDLSELLKEADTENLVEKPPVVVVMGHVDHGKTKLLDAIREADVVATESGGITQHIGAYQVSHNGKRITFLDTPGHAAFTEMRARGAKITDIAILVVAADEGIKPQTKEAYDHAKAAGVPIIVAINKIDKDGADPERVMREMADLGLQPEEWGGDTIMVPLSAITKEGIDKLLESLLVVAEVQELKANPNRPAIGTVIESNLDPSLGPIATVVINTGTLSIGNPVVIGSSYGKMKRMMDHKGTEVKKVGPSGAVRIAGLSEVPQVGDILIVTESEKVARDKAVQIQTVLKSQRFRANGMSEIISRIQAGSLKVLKIVLKADTQGSLEAIVGALNKIPSDKIRVQVIHSGVGHITANDINMAGASMGVVMGFHVTIPQAVKNLCESSGVEVRTYTIIYNLVDDVKNVLEGLLDPEVIEIDLGEAEVLQIFLTTKKEMIVGCKVNSGKIENNVMLRVIRDDKEIGSGSVTNLKKVDKAVKEVKEGHECGIRFQGDVKPEVGDKFLAYKKESKKRTL
jgi:translation initiation factor IF-2